MTPWAEMRRWTLHGRWAWSARPPQPTQGLEQAYL